MAYPDLVVQDPTTVAVAQDYAGNARQIGTLIEAARQEQAAQSRFVAAPAGGSVPSAQAVSSIFVPGIPAQLQNQPKGVQDALVKRMAPVPSPVSAAILSGQRPSAASLAPSPHPTHRKGAPCNGPSHEQLKLHDMRMEVPPQGAVVVTAAQKLEQSPTIAQLKAEEEKLLRAHETRLENDHHHRHDGLIKGEEDAYKVAVKRLNNGLTA